VNYVILFWDLEGPPGYHWHLQGNVRTLYISGDPTWDFVSSRFCGLEIHSLFVKGKLDMGKEVHQFIWTRCRPAQAPTYEPIYVTGRDTYVVTPRIKRLPIVKGDSDG